MSGGGFRAKKLFSRAKHFSAGGHPPKQISGYASAMTIFILMINNII